MKILNSDQLSGIIREFACQSRSMLFTGAGVGKNVGLPVWEEYLERLAAVCEEYGDDISAALMRKKIANGNLVGAAGVYEDCEDIPIGQRWKRLASPFANSIPEDDLKALSPFGSLPFGGIVTTNYDRSQHDAWSHVQRRAPIQIELDLAGNAIRGGADQTGFYIARLHGAAELPATMVLYPSSYDKISKNEDYQDFLLSLLRDRPCLFVGFSFVDPAIDLVLATYQRKAKEQFKTPHAALLPASDGSRNLYSRLSALNITTHYYDPSDNHNAVWRAFRKAAADFKKMGCGAKPTKEEDSPSSLTFHRFLSFAYAQVKLSKHMQPVLQLAREGIVFAVIREGGTRGVTAQQLTSELRKALTLDEEEAGRIVHESTLTLFKERQITIERDTYIATEETEDALGKSMSVLVTGVLDRLKVREDIAPVEADSNVIQRTLERTFLVRAWDHYAGGGGGYGPDIEDVVYRAIRETGTQSSDSRLRALVRSCIDLLNFPTPEESSHLSEISRSAFSVQLVLSSPRQSLLQSHALPQRVYFDASVLLPANCFRAPLSQTIYPDDHSSSESGERSWD
jgi:hypothetical protein